MKGRKDAMNRQPLASFCLKSYNQQEYIAEALEGAFAQTYRPLEIIISDDGSTDGSWEYIQEATMKFREAHGNNVSIVLNHNETNLGNLANWQKCCELAHGELLIKADGDDISLPDRTANVMEAWIKDGKRAKMVFHGAYLINPSGLGMGSLPPLSVEGHQMLLLRALLRHPSFLMRWYALRRLMMVSPCRKTSAQYYQRACLVLPRFLGDPMLFTYAFLNHWRKRIGCHLDRA